MQLQIKVFFQLTHAPQRFRPKHKVTLLPVQKFNSIDIILPAIKSATTIPKKIKIVH